MNKIIVALFAASSLLAGGSLPAFAAVDVAAVCSGSVPDAWKRPGGFCDQNDLNRSLSDPSSDPGCLIVAMIGSDRDVDVLLAGDKPVDPCNPDPCVEVHFNFLSAPHGVILAGSRCNN